MIHMDFGKDYSVLSPFKCLFYSDRMKRFAQGDFYDIRPVTVHLVPTLRCNHKCFFCTYGGLKDSCMKQNVHKKTMDAALIYKTLDQLSDNGIKGVIFTGGGEPTLYPNLIDAMKYCISKGMEAAINTNGHFLSQEMPRDLITINPTYIRISLNAGSAIVQKLTTGVDDFELILKNIEKLILLKNQMKSTTDISIGFVVNVLNVHELSKLADVLLKLEAKLRTKYNIENGIYSLQIRPVSNYENSKHINNDATDKAAGFLREKYGVSFEEEYYHFMQDGAQCSKRTLEIALNTIENDILPRFNSISNIKIIYPKQKYIDLIENTKRPYNMCLSCPWFLFIWPDGNIYHCVEWAGTKGFEIGNIQEDSLENILKSNRRNKVLAEINDSVLKKRCAPVCAHHEMNLLLNNLKYVDSEEILNQKQKKQYHHVSFL